MVKIHIRQGEIQDVHKSIIDEVVCVNPTNIPKIQEKIRAVYHGTTSAAKWENFISYSKDVWTKEYPIETWNNFNQLNNESNNTFITNNALEHLNRELNERFINPHPNLYCFIKAIKEISIKRYRNRKHQRRLLKKTSKEILINIIICDLNSDK
ncbi:hypothetical protein RF11_08808 [Thelohanellus kitauei]|uniref:Uncharacterized protein n=1 Tax=Thelohanellus kitauei TaxID=669202 RepID=A0A0C2J4J8_THEKT|nr:hypothetical protein RF11_08808 [Thelohanellus kitauei]